MHMCCSIGRGPGKQTNFHGELERLTDGLTFFNELPHRVLCLAANLELCPQLRVKIQLFFHTSQKRLWGEKSYSQAWTGSGGGLHSRLGTGPGSAGGFKLHSGLRRGAWPQWFPSAGSLNDLLPLQDLASVSLGIGIEASSSESKGVAKQLKRTGSKLGNISYIQTCYGLSW